LSGRPAGLLRGLRRQRAAALHPQLLLQLLISELKLLDRAGELADLRLELVDADREFGLVRGGALLLALLAAEQIVEKIAGARLILRACWRSGQRDGERRHSKCANMKLGHGGTIGLSAFD
jgi:hypothetical protein